MPPLPNRLGRLFPWYSHRLDGPLHLDGRQLLEALGQNGAAISSAISGDGLVPATTCAQRCVVAGVLRLARHQNRTCHNSGIADRYRRNDRVRVTRRSGCGLASGTLPRVGGLRDHYQCWRGSYELAHAGLLWKQHGPTFKQVALRNDSCPLIPVWSEGHDVDMRFS